MKPILIPLLALAAAGCGEAPSCPSPTPFPLPALTGRTVDNAGLLTPEAQDQLTAALAQVERATGHQVVVVTLPTLHGKPIEQVGMTLGNCWGIGSADRNDGVLLIVAPTERKVRIEVGIGLESTLTDREAQAIVDNAILPRFRQGRMDAGIFRGSAAVIRQIDDAGAQ